MKQLSYSLFTVILYTVSCNTKDDALKNCPADFKIESTIPLKQLEMEIPWIDPILLKTANKNC